jgi:hypothetical protein
MARGDEAIAAVIPRPGDHRDPAPRRMTTQGRTGDGGAGLLHEVGARRSGRDGAPIGLRHLVSGEKLDHCHPLVKARLPRTSCEPWRAPKSCSFSTPATLLAQPLCSVALF